MSALPFSPFDGRGYQVTVSHWLDKGAYNNSQINSFLNHSYKFVS